MVDLEMLTQLCRSAANKLDQAGYQSSAEQFKTAAEQLDNDELDLEFIFSATITPAMAQLMQSSLADYGQAGAPVKRDYKVALAAMAKLTALIAELAELS